MSLKQMIQKWMGSSENIHKELLKAMSADSTSFDPYYLYKEATDKYLISNPEKLFNLHMDILEVDTYLKFDK
jgi:hypothetical protein